jgi:hypothetical protein
MMRGWKRHDSTRSAEVFQVRTSSNHKIPLMIKPHELIIVLYSGWQTQSHALRGYTTKGVPLGILVLLIRSELVLLDV